jgi:hypothetical protein
MDITVKKDRSSQRHTVPYGKDGARSLITVKASAVFAAPLPL